MDKLTDFGHTFQVKSIACLMKNQTFLEQIHDILDENNYDSDSLKWIVKECKKYYDEYRKCITLDVFKVKTSEVENDVLKVAIVENLKEVFRHLESPDLDFIEDKALDFFKNQTLKNAIIQSVDIMESKGDFEQIKRLVDDALNAGTERNIGHEYIEHIEDRYSETARTTVPTGWDVIDDLTQGGLGGGELGVIVAPAGVGKTWVLAAIGANSMKKGRHIVHYSLELNEAYVGLRYDTVFSGTPTANIKFYQDDVQKVIDGLKGKLIIKYYPTRSASVNTLASHLKQMEIQEIKPDAVIVDYADILKPTTFYKEKRHATGETYENLRGMAGEYDIPIWTASQANRSSLEEDVIDASKVAEDYSKVMTADFVMSVSRKVEDKIANTGRVHVIKNRFGVDGITFPAEINTNTGNIQVYEASTQGGKEAQGKMDNSEEYLRQTLSKKYKDMGGFE